MNKAALRTMTRWIHLLFTIPILGYIYEPISEVGQYAAGVRFIFVPVLIFSGYWMYAGILFALLGVALWLGAFQLAGFGPALLSQLLLFIARKLWLVIRARRAS